MVDLHEREYLKSQNVVTETQCDLGLTALKLDEVLELMSTDYPEKCHVSDKRVRCLNSTDLFISSQQFNHVWQQKRRALVVTNNHGPSSISSLITAANANSSAVSQSSSVQPSDHNDKNRASVSIESLALHSRAVIVHLAETSQGLAPLYYGLQYTVATWTTSRSQSLLWPSNNGRLMFVHLIHMCVCRFLDH